MTTTDNTTGAEPAEPFTHQWLKALSDELKRPLNTLYALSATNDPFMVELPARRAKAEWFAHLWDVLGFGVGVHLRRIHYRLVSPKVPVLMLDGKPYTNTNLCWDMLCQACRDARYMRLVDPKGFVDQRSEAPLVVLSHDCDAEIGIADDYNFSPEVDAELDLTPPRLTLDPPIVRQRYMVEVWVEKSTLADILLPIHRSHGINVVTGVGQLSDVRCQELVDRVVQDGRPCRILYLSDFDPQGTTMPVAIARKIEHRVRTDDLDVDIELRPVLLTHEQCQQYRLPRIPIKESDRGSVSFQERFGAGATELDALEALHPGEIRRILLREIGRYFDGTLNRRISEKAHEVNDNLRSLNHEAVAEYADELHGLKAAYAAIAERFNAEVAPIAERLEEIRDEIKDSLLDNAPDPDAIEWPEPKDGDEAEDPLYCSSRDYVEQIDRYKRHQDKPTARRNGRGRRQPHEGPPPAT
jgi:hypothetical protein